MKATQLILLVLFAQLLLSCGDNSDNTNKHNNLISNTYTAGRDFGRVDNSISQATLDSLISASSYWLLNKLKTTNYEENLAVTFLKRELIHKQQPINRLVIYNIKTNNNGDFTFYLGHIDNFVYDYNLQKENLKLSKENPPSEIAPITGNISDYEGYYTVNLKLKTLQISLVQ